MAAQNKIKKTKTYIWAERRALDAIYFNARRVF